MAIIAVSSAPERAQYEQVSKALDLEHHPVPGLLLHTAGQLDNGEVRIVQVFTSPEAMADFQQTRLFPAFAEASVEMDLERAPQPLEAFELVTGR